MNEINPSIQIAGPFVPTDGNRLEEALHFDQEIVEATQELIDELGVGSIELEPEDIPAPETMNQIISGVEAGVEQTTDALHLDSVVDQVFSPDNPLSNEEKVKQALELLQSEFVNIQEKVAGAKEKGEFAGEMIEYLNIPMEGVLVGIQLAEKICEHIPLTAEASEILNLDLAGFGLLGIGVKCFLLQQQGKIIHAKQEHKEKLLARIERESDPAAVSALAAEIHLVDAEIDALKVDFKAEIADVTKSLLETAFEKSEEILDFVSSSAHMISAHAEVIAKLAIASAGLSVAGAVLSLGWSTYQVFQHSTKLRHVNHKMTAISGQLKEITPEKVYVGYILQAKLDRLKTVKATQQFAIATKILNAGAGSLALAVAVKGVLVASGVTVGATAGVVLGATGVAGMAVLGASSGLVAGAVVYQKRDDIKKVVRLAPVTTQTILVKQQLKRAARTHEEVKSEVVRLSEELQKTAAEQATLREIPADISEVLERRNPQVRYQETMGRMAVVLDLLNSANHREVASKERTETLTHSLEALEKKGQDISLEHKLKKLQNKFKKYDAVTVTVIQKVVEDGLKSTETRTQIKSFLQSEGYRVQGEPTWNDVLNYIVESS